jgi:uncharacterized protein (TIRG00374 family)
MRLDWRGVLGIALSVALLTWVLWDTDLGEVWRILSGSDALLWTLCAVTATAIFPLRARRWQALLAPLAGRLPLMPLWKATAIGMMVNNVLPMRAGEFARAFAISRERRDVRFPAAFASLAVDRVFDGVMVIVLMLIATLHPRFPAASTVFGFTAGGLAMSGGLFLLAVLAGLYALVLFPAAFLTLATRVVGIAGPRVAVRVRGLLESFAGGLGVLRSPSLAVEVLWWTLLHWLVNGVAFYLGFLALGIDAPFAAALFVQGLIGLSVALPSSPGFFGVFEVAAVAGLTLYGVSEAEAISWALGFHILSFIPITVIGAWYFTRMHLHLSDLREPPATGDPVP